MATDNSLQIRITANAQEAEQALSKISGLSKTTKATLDELAKSAEKASSSFDKFAQSTKALNALKRTVGGKDAFGLGNLQKSISETQKMLGQLQKTGDKFGQTFGKNLKTGLNSALKEFKKSAGAMKIEVKTVGSVKRSKTRNSETEALEKNTKALNKHAQAVEHFGFTDFIAERADRWGSKFFGEIAHLQEKRARVSAWNLTKPQQKQWNKQVRELLANNQLITEADAESMMMAAASSIGHYDPHIVGKTVARATKYAQMEKAMGYNKSEIDDIAKNYYGVAEARQVANDVEKTLKTFETVFRITTTSSGKITVADVETILRNLGPGAATLSDEGLLRLLAYAEQIKVAGRGQSGSTGAGISTVGTTTKMLQLMAMGKPSALGAKRMIAELGVMDDEVYRIVGDRVELALEGLEDESNKTERDFARQIFERGDYGQILGQAVITGDLARAGVFDKQLAQTDPVRWVQNLMPLIKQYTASEERRGSYYGQKGLDANKAGMTTEEFMKTLTEQDYLSAITSFWAKTGLSQRVINAFAIFSNEAFQHRSAAMLGTATRQKDVDALMLEQIENGNLNLAFLRAEKAVNGLIQTFEPFGAMVGKVIYQVSDFIDLLSKWSEEWKLLSKITATWATAKVAQAMIQHTSRMYNLLGATQIMDGGTAPTKKKGSKKKLASGSPEKNIQSGVVGNPFTFIMGSFDKVNAKGTSVINKLKSGVASIGGAFTRMLGGIGWGLLLADFATVLAQMAFEYTEWGKNFKAWWDELSESIKKSPIVLRMMYDGAQNRSAETNERIANLEKQVAEAKNYNLSRYQSDNLSADELRQMSKNEQIIKQGEEELKKLKTQNSTAVAEINKNLEGLNAQLQLVGFDSAKQRLASAENNLQNALNLYNESKKVYDTLKPEERQEGTLAQKDFYSRYQDLYRAKTEVENARKDLEQILSMDGVKQKYAEIDKFLADLKDTPLLYSVTDRLADALETMLGVSNENADTLAYSVKGGTFATSRYANQSVLKATAKENEADSILNRDESDLTKEQAGGIDRKKLYQTLPPATLNDIHAYSQKITANLKKAGSPSAMRYGFDSNADLMERARAQIIADLESGKLGADYKNWRSMFFKDDVDRRAIERGGYTTPDDYDWNKEVNGVTLNQLAKQQANLYRLQKYNSTFGSLGIQADDALLESNRNLFRARMSRTQVGEASLPDQTYLTGVYDLQQLQRQLAASGIRTGQQDQALDARRLALLNQTFISALQLERNYNDKSEEISLSGYTEKAKLKWDYDRDQQVEQAKYMSAMQTMEDAYNEWSRNNLTASEEEKARVKAQFEEEQLQLTMKYSQLQLQKEAELYNKLHGIDNTALNQKIDDWKDLNSQIQSFQTEMMEGFVEANEKWLDGDEDSWRDYFNNLLKMWRNMVLKQGYSDLLGMATKGATGAISGFVAGAFGREAPTTKDASDPNADKTTGITKNAVQEGAYGFGKNIYDFFAGDDEAGESGFDKLTEKLKTTFSEGMDWLGDLFDGFDLSKFGNSLMDIFSGVGDLFGDLFGGIDFGGIASSAGNWLSSIASSFFANGGIMTNRGPLPLRTYANGGIAKSAQVAVFGEGSRPEAYVPLPDGRSIPVTMNGGGAQAGGNNINISINVTNNADGSSTESNSTGTNATSNMKKLANNIKSMVKQEIVNQSRPGGLLYNSR